MTQCWDVGGKVCSVALGDSVIPQGRELVKASSGCFGNLALFSERPAAVCMHRLMDWRLSQCCSDFLLVFFLICETPGSCVEEQHGFGKQSVPSQCCLAEAEISSTCRLFCEHGWVDSHVSSSEEVQSLVVDVVRRSWQCPQTLGLDFTMAQNLVPVSWDKVCPGQGSHCRTGLELLFAVWWDEEYGERILGKLRCCTVNRGCCWHGSCTSAWLWTVSLFFQEQKGHTLGWAQGWGELFCLPLFCLVKVGLKPQLKISASARVLQEGNDKRNWLLSYKFCLGCRASLNAGQGRNKRKTKASMFCNHNALELCDLVLNAWAGCSLIVSLWCYLTPTVKQCSLPASVGKIDSATCKNSTGL